jgi:ubiquitin C-terminal hydrolase
MGSTDRGHYTAFAKRGDKWYHFDDECVTPVTDLGSLVVEHGYVLFYARKGTSTH